MCPGVFQLLAMYPIPGFKSREAACKLRVSCGMLVITRERKQHQVLETLHLLQLLYVLKLF